MRSGKLLVVRLTLLLLLPLWFSAVSLASTDQADEITKNIDILKNPRNSSIERDSALRRLMNMGEPAIPALSQALRDNDPQVRSMAGSALGMIGLAAIPALSQALQDNDPQVREAAAYALTVLGPGAKKAIPLLSQALQDNDPRVRSAAASALGGLGPGVKEAVSPLSQALRDKDPQVRESAAYALAGFGPAAKEAVPALSQALQDNELRVRSAAASALGTIGPAAKEAVPALSQALRDKDPQVRMSAAYALGMVSPAAEEVIPALSQALRDKDPQVRMSAAYALGGLGPAALEAVPALGQTLRDNDPYVRSAAASALGRLGPTGKEAMPVLTQALRDNDSEVRSAAADALGQIGPAAQAAVPALSQALRDKAHQVRSAAASALGRLGPAAHAAVPALIQALPDNESWVRSAAADALGRIGPAAQEAVPALSQALQDNEPRVRESAADALGQIGPAAHAAVPALFQALRDNEPRVRELAASALGRIGPAAKEAVPALSQALRDNEPQVRSGAAAALGQIGPAAQAAVPALIKALRDNESQVRESAAAALGGIGQAAQAAVPEIVTAFREAEPDRQYPAGWAILRIVQPKKGLNRAAMEEKISQLENLRETFFKDFKVPPRKELADQLDMMLRALRAEYEKQPPLVVEWIEKHKLQEKWWAWLVAGYLALLMVALPTWVLFFWFKPLWLYRLNETLSPVSVRIPYLNWSPGLRHLLLLSRFHHRNRILDAWVKAHLSQARARFAALDTVKARAVHVPVPVTLNGHTVAQPTPTDFQEVFRRTPFCLLIWGEGGAGKTSLACQLAGWALAKDPASSPARRPMLPVLIEHDLEIKAESGVHHLLAAIHKQVVERLTGGREISRDLLRQLLKRQRLLVIVDHFSELTPETRECIQPGYDPLLTINAMIVTSRQEEKFQGSVTDTLKPLRIRGNRLSSFLEAYLTRLDKRELYDDPEFFAACGRLTQMVGDRNLTVLLARMFADQMIVAKEDPGFEGLPDNIPDLMLSYLNWINRQESEKNPGNKTVQRLAKAISWVSLKPTFRPTDAGLAAILSALADEPDLDQKLEYLCRDLGIIQCVGPAEDKVRVSLDPVAEYLAGLRLLELYGANEVQWKAFLKEADNKEGAPQAIEGFLLAVRDCCLAKGKDYGVPGFVERGLARKTSITQETAKAAAA